MSVTMPRFPGLGGLAPLRLASGSPRRLELLRQMGLEPRVSPVDVDESRHPGEPLPVFVNRLARAKAGAGARLQDGLGPEAITLGADTVVTLGTENFGKPEDPDQARWMLARLAGREHLVLTAVAVSGGRAGHQATVLTRTRVWMKASTMEEIAAYVATGEPLDKAGAYGIQGLGAGFVARIDGSYTGVVGLPLFETMRLLSSFT